MMIQDIDLDKLNSATKYPEIPTYHTLDGKGNLRDDVPPVQFDGEVQVTEKIDGTNTRVIIIPADLIGGRYMWIIGSREELLYARNDLIVNPTLSIVETVVTENRRAIFDGMSDACDANTIITFYLETYGHRIGGNGKQYSTSMTGIRLFDISMVDISVLGMSREAISAWRKAGGQHFVSEKSLSTQTAVLAPEIVRVPVHDQIYAGDLPESVDAAAEWLGNDVGTTAAALDESGRGKAEGLVLRGTAPGPNGKRQLAKLRHEDYDRTLRRRQAT